MFLMVCDKVRVLYLCYADELITSPSEILYYAQEENIKWREGKRPGPRLNIKTVLSTYGDFHVKDKTAVRTSYL